MGKITAPVPLQKQHNIDEFDCGVDVLNHWLKHQDRRNEPSGASRTYVVCHEQTVIGYYALATGSIEHTLLPSKLKRNMPDPIPVLVLGRLAVDQQWQSKQIGRGLLKDVLLRCSRVANEIGIAALLVHCLSEHAKAFYMQYGFIESPFEKMTLLLRMKDIR